MYAMQYEILLPADYDMTIIRDRVRSVGHITDGFDGLEFKAYLIREKSTGAPHNAYAPFYVWRDIDGMRRFCWEDPGYSAIVRDFGRHPITDWTVAEFARGPADYASARSLTLQTIAMPEGAAPSQCLRALIAPATEPAADTTVARVAAVDVTTWTVIIVELSTLDHRSHESGTPAYEVLHVSTSTPPLDPA